MSDPARRLSLPVQGERPQPPDVPAPAVDPNASLEERVVAVLRGRVDVGTFGTPVVEVTMHVEDRRPGARAGRRPLGS